MSEFINDDVVDAASVTTSWITMALAVVGCIFLLCLVVYGANCYGGFLGAIPIRSDFGSSKRFDLQREIDKLIEKQTNNIGAI